MSANAKQELPRVTVTVYLLSRGLREDQLAGFRRWVAGRKLRRLTVPEWDALWTDFQARPVR
jgi:hypothetical protein